MDAKVWDNEETMHKCKSPCIRLLAHSLVQTGHPLEAVNYAQRRVREYPDDKNHEAQLNRCYWIIHAEIRGETKINNWTWKRSDIAWNESDILEVADWE